MAYARACYGWAAKANLVEANPFAGLAVPGREKARHRVLSVDEVQRIWSAAEVLQPIQHGFIRFLLLTLQRRTEVAGTTRSEISADMTTWTIPKERAKDGRANVVHLAPAARAILAELPRFAGSGATACDLVFTTNGRTTVSGFSRAKAKIDELMQPKRIDAAGEPLPALRGWRLHDLRRTAVTWMAENGMAPHVADRLLNHVQGTISGVAAVYQREEFLVEREAALEAWARRVLNERQHSSANFHCD